MNHSNQIEQIGFLCIGAGKAGTTWLHQHFSCHHDLSIPLVKELHHLDKLDGKRRISLIFKRSIFGTQIRGDIFRGVLSGQLFWLWKYLFHKRSIENYNHLFSHNTEKLSGEICPSYALLPKSTIQKFNALNPQCKIIYILRNPVARIWSHSNMIRKRKSIHFTDQYIYDRINEKQHKASHYLSNLDNWEHYYPKENIFVGFFDELKSDPEMFLNKIYSFLGVSPLSTLENSKKLGHVVNKGSYNSIPLKYKIKLTSKYIDQFRLLDARFNNPYTSQWLKDAKQLLQQYISARDD